MHPLSKAIIRRTPPRARSAVTLLVRTLDDTIDDRVPGLAAEIAFFVVLSLPPLLLTVLAGVGFVGDLVGQDDFQQAFADTLVNLADDVLSADAVDDIIRPTVTELADGSVGLLSVAFVLTLWTASRAVKVVLTALSIAYDIPQERTGLQQRLWGLGLTLVGVVAGSLLVPAFVAGPRFGARIEEWLGLDAGLSAVYAAAYWPGAVLVMTFLIASLYHFGAPWSTPWRRDLPGALLAVATWTLGTLGLRVYFSRTIAEDAAYNPLAGALAVLLWLYVTGFAVLLGAEFNAEIEKLWPTHGQQPLDPVADADEPGILAGRQLSGTQDQREGDRRR